MQDIDLTKDILSGKEIRAKLINGANKVANAVKSTLGPMGRNVILELNKYGDSRITKDGVSVAKEIFLEDKYENLGAQLLKKVSLKSTWAAGTGIRRMKWMSFIRGSMIYGGARPAMCTLTAGKALQPCRNGRGNLFFP